MNTPHDYTLASRSRAASVVLISALLLTPSVNRTDAQSVDPCASAASSLDLPQASPQHDGHDSTKPTQHRATPTHLDALWAHRAQESRAMANKAATSSARAYATGDIAIVEDAGDLLIRANRFDLHDSGLRFSPTAGAAYTTARISYGFRQPLGSRLVLGDDDSRENTLLFEFPFFGERYGRLYLNSDGNITFGSADSESTDRSVHRLLTGPPRVASLFTDLDPASGGRVLVSNSASAYTVTWCSVPEYGSTRRATTQVTLLPSGAIEMQFSSLTSINDAIVAIGPGNTSHFLPGDLSGGIVGESGSAIGERYTSQSDLDTVSTLQRFFTAQPDEFDNVVIFADSSVITEGFAYELTVANAIQGLNIDPFNASADWGSNGTLESLVVMDGLEKYPDDPREVFLGSNSTLSVLGQEFGHRWLAFFTYRDAIGRTGRDLLGRDNSHWSFFFDSDASVMEGNDIEDLGNGQFRTVAATNRYSMLDQYAMGLVDSSQVPPVFVVQNITEVSPVRNARSSPEVGVTFRGTRRNVTIDEIISSTGRRVPSAAVSKRDYRQAFVYVTSAGRETDAGAVEKLDRIRVAWEQFLSAATNSRMRVDTRLPRASTSGRAPVQ
jgi:hypothetical protein